MPTGSAFTVPDDWNNTSPLASSRLQTLAEDTYFNYLRIQQGKITVVFSAQTSRVGTLTFPVSFPAAPIVILTTEYGGSLVCNTNPVSAGSFTWGVNVQAGQAAISGTVILHWVAVKA